MRAPRENLVGPLHGGWGVAKGLLKHERKLMSEIGVESATRAYSAVEASMTGSYSVPPPGRFTPQR